MARLRSAPSSQPPASGTASTRHALKEKTNTASATKLPGGDDAIKDFVKDARPTRGRAKKAAQNGEDFVMAGGLGHRSDAPSEAPMTTDELAKSDGPAPPTAQANRRPPRQTRKPAQSEAQSKVFEDMKKRMRATAQKEATSDKIVDAPLRSDNAGPSSDALPTKPPPARKSNATVVERSDFSISPSPPPPGKLSAVKNKRSSAARPDSVLKSQSTPTAETSVLALKHFKRRPRQPSMLAMVQQRTAGARPSVTQVQATEVEAEDPSVFDLEGSEEDEDEFAPDAEGTPLHLRKAKRTSILSEKLAPSTTKKKPAVTAALSASKKRKSSEADHSTSSLSALRAKRQKPSNPANDTESIVNVPASVEPPASPDREETPRPDLMSEVQVIGSSPSSTPPTEPSSADRRPLSLEHDIVVPSTEEQLDQDIEEPLFNDIDDDEQSPPTGTMAEPVSSSSPSPEDLVATQRTDIMADPLTQLSPPRPQRDKEKKTKPKPVMTATLQSLLPKRRQPAKPRHRKSEYDIDSDSEEERDGGDDSEVEEDGRNRRRTKTASTKNRKSTAKSKASTTARKSTAPTRKSTAPPSRRKTAPAGKKTVTATRTYGRTAASDKENDPGNSDFDEDEEDSLLPDMSLTMHEAAVSNELAAAKAKFAEVDGWDMEFESVSFEEGRSSSQTWR